MMCYKMQGNNDDFNELPSGTVGWAVSCRGKVGFREYCSFFLSSFPFLFSGLRLGLGLWLGLGFKPKRSNCETIS